MRGVLDAFEELDRVVWVADSFEGLPEGDLIKYPKESDFPFHDYPQLTVNESEVKRNFKKNGLLHKNRVRFLKGWFRDTLFEAPIDELSVLRLDGDLYESTTDALNVLYHKLSIGGWCIVDDYGCVPACAEAVRDFFSSIGQLMPDLQEIDWTGVYWKKVS